MSVKSISKTPLLAAAMAVALSTAAVQQASAAEMEMEKCYGVAKAGHNDCQTANSSCAGTSKMDGQKDAFVAVPKGTCAKIAGGSTKSM
ncbi:DUF2282 domain-containing protein [Magnetovibrio sp.]|uniref:BufA1 family periplasmic bufferin-type metallophore n=1 Tax=Magnetovibrio sp. TaxID=2024836 RepID=UPI002F9428D1